MIKGIIFDADGTLIDSMPFWNGLLGKFLEKYGIEIDGTFIRTIEPMTPAQASEYTIKHFNLPVTGKQMSDYMNGIIYKFYTEEVKLKPGIVPFLEKMKAEGIKMTVATGTDTPLVSAGLKRTGIYDYFVEVLSCADVGKRKTEPDIYRIALEHLGTEKDETVIFEDALYCLKTAKADGFRTVAVYDSTEPGQEEMLAESDFNMKDYDNSEGFLRFFG